MPTGESAYRLSSLLALFLLVAIHISWGHFINIDTRGEYAVGLSFNPVEPAISSEPTQIVIGIFNSTSGYPVTDLEITHEKIMHVVIISEDLHTFAHLHPDDYENGTAYRQYGQYAIPYTFPRPGNYAVLIDFSINGQTVQKTIKINVTAGTELQSQDQTIFMDIPNNDFGGSHNFNGYDVSLTGDANIETWKEAAIDFNIWKDGKPVTDLQQYLGTEIHVIVLKSDLSIGGHTHSFVPGHYVHYGNMTQRYSGPTVPIRLTFTEPGTYAMFGQFKENGNIVTTKFMMNVAPASADTMGLIIGVAEFGIVIILLLAVYFAKKKKS